MIMQKHTAIIADAVCVLIDFTVSFSAFSFEKGAISAVMQMVKPKQVIAI